MNKVRLLAIVVVGLLWGGQLLMRNVQLQNLGSTKEFMELIPQAIPAIVILILAVVLWFVRKKLEKRKFLLEYGFVANAKIISITNSMVRVNNVPLKNAVIEFNGTEHTIKHESPKTFEKKNIGDTIRVRYNSQNTEEFMIDPMQV